MTTTVMSTRQINGPNDIPNGEQTASVDTVNQQMANTRILTTDEIAANELVKKRLQRKEKKAQT